MRNENNLSEEWDFVSRWNFVNLSVMGPYDGRLQYNRNDYRKSLLFKYQIFRNVVENATFHVKFIIKSTRTNRNLSKYVINILVCDLLWSRVIHSKKKRIPSQQLVSPSGSFYILLLCSKEHIFCIFFSSFLLFLIKINIFHAFLFILFNFFLSFFFRL